MIDRLNSGAAVLETGLGRGRPGLTTKIHGWIGTLAAWRANLALFAVFSLFLVVQIRRHAMWSDELNAWGIVLDSPTLGSLFHHLHYEGHPGLWHLLLWFASSVSAAPAMMKVIHGAVALAIVAMVAFASPFSRCEKGLVLLGYFVVFEYTVVNRNYGIALLLALVYAHRRARRPDQTGRNALLLGLLANTNVFALILSAALALEYGVERLGRARSIRAGALSLLGPALLLAACAAFSVATFWPASDISWRTTGRPFANGFSADELANVVVNNLSALVPLDVQGFWFPKDANPIYGYAVFRLLILVTAPFLAVLAVRIFRADKRLLLIPAITLMGSIGFNLCFYEGSIRHWGVNFVAFLTALWILRATLPSKTPWALPLLVLNAMAGVVFTVGHWVVPFSNADDAVSWIQAENLTGVPIIGTPDNHLAAIAELLGRPVWFLDCGCSDTYLAYTRQRDDFSKDQIPQRLLHAIGSQPAPVTLYINSEPATPQQVNVLAAQNLAMHERVHFTSALNDRYWIYEIVPRPAVSVP